MATSTTNAQSADGTGRRQSRLAPGIPPLLAIILASWFTISPFVIRYPLTLDGEDAALRDRGLALLLLFTSVSWYRARTHRRAFQLAYGLLAALLVVEALVYGGGPGGSLGGAPWSELATGILMLLTVAAGWRTSGTVEVSPS
jgi:hypothetical protein